MTEVVERYAKARPGNPLERFLPALRAVEGSDAHTGLGKPFTRAWAKAAEDPAFRAAQDAERDAVYFGPAVRQAEEDGLGALGQFIYYDAYVMHGADDTEGTAGFRTMRREAMAAARPPARGGDEKAYLNAFLDARVAAMAEEPAHSDTSRVETAQRVFVREGKLRLETPLRWKVYGDAYRIEKD
jgi:chitosanase